MVTPDLFLFSLTLSFSLTLTLLLPLGHWLIVEVPRCFHLSTGCPPLQTYTWSRYTLSLYCTYRRVTTCGFTRINLWRNKANGGSGLDRESDCDQLPLSFMESKTTLTLTLQPADCRGWAPFGQALVISPWFPHPNVLNCSSILPPSFPFSYWVFFNSFVPGCLGPWWISPHWTRQTCEVVFSPKTQLDLRGEVYLCSKTSHIWPEAPWLRPETWSMHVHKRRRRADASSYARLISRVAAFWNVSPEKCNITQVWAAFWALQPVGAIELNNKRKLIFWLFRFENNHCLADLAVRQCFSLYIIGTWNGSHCFFFFLLRLKSRPVDSQN